MKISIIVPAFNEEQFLGKTLAQIKAAAGALANTGWETELIVCDNNSTDRTAEIARAAGANVVLQRTYADATLWAAAPDDAAVYGDIGSAPLLQRFDGHAWTTVAVPPGIERVAAYDRTSQGNERIFAYTGKALSMFERASGAAPWQPITLPTLTLGDEVHEVWLANDDAWLLVWPGPDACRRERDSCASCAHVGDRGACALSAPKEGEKESLSINLFEENNGLCSPLTVMAV